VQPELSPNTPSTQAASGNKLADAIASVLLPQIVEAVGASQQTKELEREVNRLRMQVEELQELRTKYEVQNVTLANERDAALARVNEMEAAIAELNEEVEKFRGMAMELERDRDNLKLTLAELGLDSDVVQPAPEVNWDETPVTEPDTVSWDEEDELSLNSDVTQAASEVNWEDEELGESSESASDLPNEPDDTEEEEGFDLSSLGE
jgi:predicted RNase H-like nuclease (RuvC/YqgF family)